MSRKRNRTNGINRLEVTEKEATLLPSPLLYQSRGYYEACETTSLSKASTNFNSSTKYLEYIKPDKDGFYFHRFESANLAFSKVYFGSVSNTEVI